MVHQLAAVDHPTTPVQGAPQVADTHDIAHEHGDTAAQDAVSSGDDCEEMGDHGRSGCGSCTSCSIGAYAPPPVLTISAIEEVVIGRQQFISSSFTGHIPARIERPPRTV